MIIILMVIVCGVWGIWCGDKNVHPLPMIIGAACIGMVFHGLKIMLGA